MRVIVVNERPLVRPHSVSPRLAVCVTTPQNRLFRVNTNRRNPGFAFVVLNEHPFGSHGFRGVHSLASEHNTRVGQYDQFIGGARDVQRLYFIQF